MLYYEVMFDVLNKEISTANSLHECRLSYIFLLSNGRELHENEIVHQHNMNFQ